MCQDTLTKLQKNKSHIAQEVSKKKSKNKNPCHIFRKSKCRLKKLKELNIQYTVNHGQEIPTCELIQHYGDLFLFLIILFFFFFIIY